MIAFVLFFLLIVGMVFFMRKSEDFAAAVSIVIGTLVGIMLLALAISSCS